MGVPDPDHIGDWIASWKRKLSTKFVFSTLLTARQLGYSALVGLGVLILGLPIQTVLVMIMFKQRKKGVKFTDTRLRLTTEVRNCLFLPRSTGSNPLSPGLARCPPVEGVWVGKVLYPSARAIAEERDPSIEENGVSARFLSLILTQMFTEIQYSTSGHNRLDVLRSRPRRRPFLRKYCRRLAYSHILDCILVRRF